MAIWQGGWTNEIPGAGHVPLYEGSGEGVSNALCLKEHFCEKQFTGLTFYSQSLSEFHVKFSLRNPSTL